MKHREVGIGYLDAEVRQQLAAVGQGEIQVTIANFAQLTGHPQPVQPQRRVKTPGQYQLGGLGRPALDQIGHVPGHRWCRDMEVVDDDRRPFGQLGGIVGDRRDDVSRHVPVHRQQVGGIGAEGRFDGARDPDEPGQEPERIGIGTIAGQPSGNASWPGRSPVRQQHALAGPSRPDDDGQPPGRPCRQPLTQPGPHDQGFRQGRWPEFRQREPRIPGDAMFGGHAVRHDTSHHNSLLTRKLRDDKWNLRGAWLEGTKVLLRGASRPWLTPKG